MPVNGDRLAVKTGNLLFSVLLYKAGEIMDGRLKTLLILKQATMTFTDNSWSSCKNQYLTVADGAAVNFSW